MASTTGSPVAEEVDHARAPPFDRRTGVTPPLVPLTRLAAVRGALSGGLDSTARELIAAAAILAVLALWWLSRTARLRSLAPLTFAATATAIAVLLVVLATSPLATALFALALALAVVALGDAVWRSPRHGPSHHVDRWWSDFERDFRAYASQNTRPPRR